MRHGEMIQLMENGPCRPGREALLTHRLLFRKVSCYGLPSMATMRNLAYLSPTLRFSLYSFEECQALAFSMLSHCWMATRFAGAPSNAVPLPAASSLPPFSLISACAFGAYSFMYASLLPTSISAMVYTGGFPCACSV